jgi:rhodanese-related sulfurtransferase
MVPDAFCFRHMEFSMTLTLRASALLILLCVSHVGARETAAQSPRAIRQAVVGETVAATPELSTGELETVLSTGNAVVLDARPYDEFAVGHIPGAVNVAPKAGVAMSMYISDVAEIGRLVKGNKAMGLVLYCNGPHCGKSTRLAAELLEAGYTNVRRYQLGMPVWRALGGAGQVELEGVVYALTQDRTTVIVDVREPSQFKGGSLPQAVNIPRSLVVDAKDMGEVRRAKDDGRLPMNDHNTRVIVVGPDAATARHVAGRIALEAFSNVSFYAGAIADIRARLSTKP